MWRNGLEEKGIIGPPREGSQGHGKGRGAHRGMYKENISLKPLAWKARGDANGGV